MNDRESYTTTSHSPPRERHSTHPLVTASVAILAFLALLHTLALPLAYFIRRADGSDDGGVGPLIIGYVLAAVLSAVVLGFTALMIRTDRE